MLILIKLAAVLARYLYVTGSAGGIARAIEMMRTTRLPAPRHDSDVALEYCMRQRRSVRGFSDEALTERDLGQLLWSAQGITSVDGKRTVPSAGGLYPLSLYTICGNVASVAPGAYRYSADEHELVLIASDDQRRNLAIAVQGQEWIATAPAIVCVAAAFARTMTRYGDRGRGYVYMEAGHAAENLMLTAVALGLATTMVGAFRDDAIKCLFHLAADETPLCLIPVGAP